MATVTGLTAARMLAIEAATVVSGSITGGILTLTKHDGTTITVGSVGGGTGGTAGAPGSVWRSGAGAPATALGIIGDWYIDSTTGNFYEKTGTALYTLRGNLMGPTGPAGATGATGATGGTGSAGTPGSVWRSAAGAPATTLGAVGDFYLNTTNGDYYEKTSLTVYTLRGNLTGPAGTGSGTGTYVQLTAFPVTLAVAMSDENTNITTAGVKAKIRSPFAFTLTGVRITANTNAATGALPTVDVLKNGVSVMTTKATINNSALSSIAATAQPVISGGFAAFADDDLISFSLDVVPTTLTGLKVYLFGTRDATPASVSGAPTGLTLSRPGSAQIGLSWTAPVSPGSTIVGYKIEARVSGGTWTTVTNNTTSIATTATISTVDGTTALTNGVSYDVRVSTVTLVGTGSPGTPASITPATVPGVPTGLSGAAVTPTGILVAWTAPLSNGGMPITSYTVGYRLTSSGPGGAYTLITGITGTSASLTGLTATTGYDIEVQAVNVAGNSAFATATATSGAAGGGGAPTFVNAVTTGADFANTAGVVSLSPGAVSVGDMVLCLMSTAFSAKGGASPSLPTGFTAISGVSQIAGYLIVTTAGTPTYSCVGGALVSFTGMTLLVYRGATTINAASGTSNLLAGANPAVAPSVTTTLTNCKHVVVFSVKAAAATTSTLPAGYTSRLSGSSAVAGNVLAVDKDIATASATGTVSTTWGSIAGSVGTYAASIAIH